MAVSVEELSVLKDILCVECGEIKQHEDYNRHRVYKCRTKGTCKTCIAEMTPTHRKCVRCEEIKPMEDYGILEKNKFGRNNICIVCSKEKMDNYYKENGGRAREVKRQYRERTKDQKKKVDKAYREANKDSIREMRRKYRKKNKEAIAHRKKMYYASDAGRAVKRRHEEKRVLQIRATDDGSITKYTLDELFTEQDGRCYICDCDLTQLKNSKVHLDHIKPLSKGGTHTLENVAWACSKCNLEKGGAYGS